MTELQPPHCPRSPEKCCIATGVRGIRPEAGDYVVSLALVQDTDDVMLMTNTGQSVRIPVAQIREAGRNTQGVKLISLREGELLQDIAKMLSEGDETAADAPPVEGEST